MLPCETMADPCESRVNLARTRSGGGGEGPGASRSRPRSGRSDTGPPCFITKNKVLVKQVHAKPLPCVRRSSSTLSLSPSLTFLLALYRAYLPLSRSVYSLSPLSIALFVSCRDSRDPSAPAHKARKVRETESPIRVTHPSHSRQARLTPSRLCPCIPGLELSDPRDERTLPQRARAHGRDALAGRLVCVGSGT